MIERLLGIILILTMAFFTRDLWPLPNVVHADTSSQAILNTPQPLTTQSRFSEKLEEETEAIPRKTVYKDDPDTEIGTDTVLDEGADGKITKIIKITYYQGEEYSREVVSSETTPPKDKLVSRGTKIVWRTTNTADGPVRYWKKMHVWATDYDSHCPGCNEWTATGMHQGKGVVAVDPKVIPLGSKIYVPGYGMAIAGDTGGAVKGNIIDLGVEDAKSSEWTSRFVDIYLL